MGFSYGAKPQTDQKDEIRLLIGDTDSNDPLLQDAEINYFISVEGESRRAAARSALAIVAKFARCVNESVGRIKVSFEQRVDHYNKLAEELMMEADAVVGTPFAGGISVSDKQTTELDDDRVQPQFNRATHENPRNRFNSEERIDDDFRR